MIAAIALRTLHEVFEADQGSYIDVAVYSGWVEVVDPATGNDIRPHLISVRATKREFTQIRLDRVQKDICLRNLGAQVSRQPAELTPVRPIIDFNTVDRRFIQETDVLSTLESRPNLMELTPAEFENLVSNLFAKRGLEARLTRSSRDGGVDAVLFDRTPITGGKIVVQAKRYSHTVGISAVRDLYGTVMNEGAGKGILVSTSGYGPDAYEFVKDKPIELIDGAGLLFYLQEAGIEARIVFQQDAKI